MREGLEDFIRANLPIVDVPDVPGIRLHKAVPESRIGRLADTDQAGFGSPYWAYHWAGGLALARHLLDHPAIVAGKKVLDLGAGGGLVAIAAAKAGAAQVIAAEIDPYATAILPLNAALNHVAIEVIGHDFTDGDPPAMDVVLVGDLFYADELAARVSAFLDRCHSRGIDILVGDPWRPTLPITRLCEVARYPVSERGGLLHRDSGVFSWIPL